MPVCDVRNCDVKLGASFSVFLHSKNGKVIFSLCAQLCYKTKLSKISRYIQNLRIVKKSFCNTAVHIVNFAIKDAKKRKNIKIRLPYSISTAYNIRQRSEHRKIIADSESTDAKHTN